MSISDLSIDFPGLEARKRGKKIIYFNHFDSCLMPSQVINVLDDYYEKEHDEHEEISRSVKTVKKFLHARKNKSVVFTNSHEETVREIIKREKNGGVLLTNLASNQVLIDWMSIIKSYYLDSVFFKLNIDFNTSDFVNSLGEGIKLVVVPFISNCTGVTFPAKEIVEACHENGIKVVVDAQYGAAHKKINVNEWGADYVILKPDNLCGPEGISVFYSRENRQDDYCDNGAGIIGTGAGIEYLNRVGMRSIERQVEYIAKNIREGIDRGKATMLGEKGPVVNVKLKSFEAKKARVLLEKLNNVMVSTSLRCGQWVNDNGHEESLLICPYFYNNLEDVKVLLSDLKNILL